MIDDPDRWAPDYAEAGAANVTFHVEAARRPGADRPDDPGRGRHGGPGDRPRHPARALPRRAREFDTLLIMTIKAGFGGQAFIPELLRKVRLARRHIQTGHLRLLVEVDGGIDADTIEAAAEAGADVFVAGTAVYGADDPGKAVEALRARAGRRWAGREAAVRVTDGRAGRDAPRAWLWARRCAGVPARTRPSAPSCSTAPVSRRRRGHPVAGGSARRGRGAARGGRAARGGTAVVTSEPCAHTGRPGRAPTR